MMSFEEVKKNLKQRFPFIMVDRVLEFEPEKIKAVKHVTGNEMVFLGHFPEYSILPGVLIIESIAQTASLLFSKGKAVLDSRELMVLGGVRDMKFLKPVLPGYAMTIDVEIIKAVEDAAIVQGVVLVEGEIAAKGKMTFAKRKM